MIEEFLRDRCGSVGGSDIGKALAVLKKASGGRLPGEPTQAAYDFQFDLAAQQLTGYHQYVNPLEWGNRMEEEARQVYAVTTNSLIVYQDNDGKRLVIPHPTIRGSHASPDGLVGEDGGVEFKCPTSAVHLKTLFFGEIPEEHLAQIHWNMACNPDRLWWDFQSYDPRFIRTELQIFVRRIHRDDRRIAEMEAGVRNVLAGKNKIIDRVMERFSL